MKTFCIAGPIITEYHYYLPQRLDWNLLDQFLENKFYFLVHAPRQSGKTTAIIEYVNYLNKAGKYTALYLTTEPAHIAKNNIERTVYWLLEQFVTQLDALLPKESESFEYLKSLLKENIVAEISFYRFLEFWSKKSSRPVIFFDEIDGLEEKSLIFFLKQLRTGYTNRPQRFPQSICLISVRELKDYKLLSHDEKEKQVLASPFNIIAESIVLQNFTEQDVYDLYMQHTNESGQIFERDAISYAYYLTQGQPWLVNALAYQATSVELVDRSKPITKDVIEKAKNYLIAKKATHLDALLDRLNEKRVKDIIDAIIIGESIELPYSQDDIQYVTDLGLISSKSAGLQIANPIYKEIIPAALSYKFQKTITENMQWYENKDGSINMHKLLSAFTQFFRENSQAWLVDFEYKESGPHILMMAFLQRIINGGGTISREYALGRKRVDLLIQWKNNKYVIELKIKHSEQTLSQGLLQTSSYMDTSNAQEGHLVIFDRDPMKSWEDKISNEQLEFQSKKIHVWTM